MSFYDHDLHIHSYISPCASEPERSMQTVDRILQYAEENKLNTICVTDHFWDENVTPSPYGPEYPDVFSFKQISSIRPLPQRKNIRFLFGCETELHADGRIAISEERIDEFDFIIVPTTHFHNGYVLTLEEEVDSKSRAKAWVKKFEILLNSNLPFHKVGVAHLTTTLIAPTLEQLFEVFKLIPDAEMERLFKRSAELGLGIELNVDGMNYIGDEAELMFKPFVIAKECGCKFYCGSDAHRPFALDRTKGVLESGLKILNLSENDKFDIQSLGVKNQ